MPAEPVILPELEDDDQFERELRAAVGNGADGVDLGSDSNPVVDVDPTIDLTRNDSGLFNPLKYLRGPGATAIVVIGVALTALLVLNQGLGVLGNIAGLPAVAQWFAYPLLAVIVLAIVLAATRVVLSFVRFKASPRYSAKALDALAERAELREESKTDLDRARKELKKILERYPVTKDIDRASLIKVGFKDTDFDDLTAARDQLLVSYLTEDTKPWLKAYRSEFVGVLDRVAARRSRQRALLVGAKSAAVPHGGFDTAVVLAHSYLLIGDLCTIYQVRTDQRGTIAITWRILMGAFIAGRLDEWTDNAAQQLVGVAGGASGGVLAKAGSAIAGKLIGKAAEGVVNATFCYRLGRAAMRRLRPID